MPELHGHQRREAFDPRARPAAVRDVARRPVIDDLWRSEAVEDALDLCLACKACQSECPMNVDMATYKAEFRAHHYDGRLRPRAAYSMGLIHQVVAHGAQSALARQLRLTGRAVGSAQVDRRHRAERALPAVTRTRRSSSGSAGDQRSGDRTDTGSCYGPIHSTTLSPRDRHRRNATARGRSATRSSFRKHRVCCGRPLYDWGMLDQGQSAVATHLDILASEIGEGTPMIGLEPRCVSAFRDELPRPLPHDERAKRLSQQTLFLTEFLARKRPIGRTPHRSQRAGAEPLSPSRRAGRLERGRHAEAHRRSTIGCMESGCCGMAGSFGFEARQVRCLRCRR